MCAWCTGGCTSVFVSSPKLEDRCAPSSQVDHQTFGCSRCWTDSDDSSYIVSRNFEFAHTSASMCPSSPTKTCHKIPNMEAMLVHTTDKCTTDNVFLLWKTGWSAFYQVPQDDAPSQRCAEAHCRGNSRPAAATGVLVTPHARAL